jgi:hypothetical protein
LGIVHDYRLAHAVFDVARMNFPDLVAELFFELGKKMRRMTD